MAEFENDVKKNLFITMLLAIINDLDASFSSNILEIEKVFLEDGDEEYDEDLEFF